MGKRVFTKTVEIGGAAASLLSIDGVTWSTSLTDLERFEAGRKAEIAITRRMMKRIGIRDGLSTGRAEKRNHFVRNAQRIG